MSQASSGTGIGFGSLLTIVFITLKLCNVIDWSWWLVLAPTWMPISLVLVIIAFCLLMALIFNRRH